MEGVAEKIALFHNLFVICIVGCVICCIIAAVVFFLFDIPKVWGYLTGRNAKRQIQQMEESSAASGRLMTRQRSNMHNMAQGIKDDMGVRDTITPGARKVETIVQTANEGSDATALLREEVASEHQPEVAEVQHQVVEQTPQVVVQTPTVPEMQEDGTTGILDVAQMAIGSFVIEKEIILIHAEEVI